MAVAVRVGVGVLDGVLVDVGVGVFVDVDVGIFVDVDVSVFVDVDVGVFVDVGDGVSVDVDVGVSVDVGVGVFVDVGVSVDVEVGVFVEVGVYVDVAVYVDVGVDVFVDVGVSIDVGVGVGVDVDVFVGITLGVSVGVSDGRGLLGQTFSWMIFPIQEASPASIMPSRLASQSGAVNEEFPSPSKISMLRAYKSTESIVRSPLQSPFIDALPFPIAEAGIFLDTVDAAVWVVMSNSVTNNSTRITKP